MPQAKGVGHETYTTLCRNEKTNKQTNKQTNIKITDESPSNDRQTSRKWTMWNTSDTHRVQAEAIIKTKQTQEAAK